MFVLDSKIQDDSVFIEKIGLCRLVLMNNSYYPWVILVPELQDIVEITDLRDYETLALFNEITIVSRIMQKIYKPYKLNIATIGNIVRQFHVHIVARFKDDISWPNPVWGNKESKQYQDSEITKIKNMIKQELN